MVCIYVSAKTTFATIAFLTVLLFPLTIIDKTPLLASAKESDSKVDPNNNNNKNLTQYYACTDYGDLTHCDRSLGEMRSYQVAANWTELYQPSGTPMFTEGKYEKALMLQSKRLESVEINNTIGLNPKEFSVSFWIKPQPMTEPYGIIISHSNFENNAGWSFKISNNASVSFEIYDSEGKATVIKDKSNITTDRFTNIVGTFDGTKVRMYVDGHLASDKDFTGRYTNDPASPLRIGGAAGSMGYLLWTGVIDDLAFYNRSLSNSDIDLLSSSNSSYPATNKESGLVGHWSFDNNLMDSSSTTPSQDGSLRTLIASMAFSPDGRLFFTEKNSGNIRVMLNDNRVLAKPFASIHDLHVSYEQGLLGLVVDPLFEKNHFVYVYYTAMDNNKVINKIVRFTDINNSGTDPTVLLDDIPALDGYHSGGALAFGPDGKLYIGVGDATQPTFAQNPSISLGKVLRVNKDGTIPPDNPYPNSPVYTLGHRNVYGIAFDNKSDFGIIAENGDQLYDEINIIEKGGNYGFPTLQPPNLPPELANPDNSILPVKSYWRTPGPTQAIFYDGNKFPEIKDSFLIGAVDGSLYSLNFSKIDKKSIEEVRITPSIYPFSAVTSVAESPTGDVYFGSYSIYKMTGLDYSNKEQITFPVKFDFSNNYTQIDNVNVFKGAHNSMQIDFHTSNQSTEEKQADSLLLSIEIPKKLLNGIYSVNKNDNVKDKDTSNDYVRGVDFTIDDLPSSPITIVKIRYSPSVDYSISILGDNFIREYSQSNRSSVFEGALNKNNIDSNITAIKDHDPKTPSPLSIEIKSPLKNFTFLEGKINVIGNSASNGHESNIQKVEISYLSLTENKTVPYKLAKPILPGDWSEWTSDLVIDEPGYYKILARVTDNRGEQGWDSITIQIPFFIDPKTNYSDSDGNGNDSYGIHNKTNIAFVENTFTESAYSDNGFYTFYYKYNDIPKKVKVTSDLSMLTTEIPDKASQKVISKLAKHLNNTLTNATFTNIKDTDVHNGRIFSPHNEQINAYDILILFHEEYVTQQMYDYFQRFVNNGGVILFMDANLFIAEVNYNNKTNSITLVKGHGWEFNQGYAQKTDPERWFNETRDWVGSNFVNRPIAANITFENIPFNYSHYEDNYITNPNAKVLFDYKANFSNDEIYGNSTIAAYELSKGKGKVISLGIFAENALDDEKFFDFFDRIILDKALKSFIQIRSPPVEIAAPLGGEILNDVITKPIATIKDIALSHTNKDSISKIKKVEYKIDNSNYQFAKTFYTNHWSDWDTSLGYPSYGNHAVLNKVTHEYENTYGAPKNIIEAKDKFGIQKIYPTKEGGREWYVNMENPRLDDHFLLGGSILEKQSDGSWETGSRITGDDEYDEGGSKYHLLMGVNTLQGEDEWRDVEITGYFKIKSIQSDEPSGLQWYARGGNHSDDNPCDGTSLKGRILSNGTAGWKKEIWHDGGYTEQRGSVLKATSSPLEDRWIGWKVIMYNINENKAVKMESYIDDDNNNRWKKVTSLIDDGKWYASSTDEVFHSANCGTPKDYIVTNSGSIAAFRSDGVIWDFKNLSVREITPLHHSLQY